MKNIKRKKINIREVELIMYNCADADIVLYSQLIGSAS